MEYQTMPIDEIESLIEDNAKTSESAQKTMIYALIYLRASGRYRENKRYERATFYSYIESRFNIRRVGFLFMQKAFVNFPSETDEFGAGTAVKVLRQCGAKRAKEVFHKLKKAKESVKTELRLEKIDSIINAASPKIEKKVTDYKAMYEREAEAHSHTKEQLREAIAENERLENQVEKLKATASRLSSIRDIVFNGHKVPTEGVHAGA